MSAVSLFSGGIASFFATLRYCEQNRDDDVTLLFTDTMTEDADLYRFLDEAVAFLEARFAVRYVRLADGRDIWQVFRDEKLLGNTRMDPCSRILKRDLSRKWIEANTDHDAPIILGFAWDEQHRHERTVNRWAPRPVVSPLLRPPYLTRDEMFRRLGRIGIEVPRLYRVGLAHNNCGGGCVKAGQGHFAHLLKVLPDVYDDWERNEQVLRDQLGDVSILRDRQGGSTNPLTLTALRERIESGQPCDLWDIGGCGCFEEAS